MIKIIECPRDAWQALPKIIPPENKAEYLARLIEAGFRHIDAVSFVSPKYVPQMADSEEVLQRLHLNASGGGLSGDDVEVIGIVVNERGFNRALATVGVTTIGYPHSISERFSRQNANLSIADSRALVERMAGLIRASLDDPGRQTPELVIYVSMGFGNPYGEGWNAGLVEDTVEWLKRIGIRHVSIADTAGKAAPEEVAVLVGALQGLGRGVEIGVHLHSRPEGAAEKIIAAYENGCRRFDCALTGLGGCPFTGDHLVGNIPTEIVLETLGKLGEPLEVDRSGLESVLEATKRIRAEYGGGSDFS
jgi:hydroxymethylglutaryl-CoA lyase